LCVTTARCSIDWPPTTCPISGDVARKAGLLQVEHRDPFDRLLAAQAMAENLLLASSDPVFTTFPDLALLR
jgi:PIN domain nuclease of toxin-antitoxin system